MNFSSLISRFAVCRAVLLPLALVSFCTVSSAQSPPSALSRTYTYPGGNMVVDFHLHPVRGPAFEVYVHDGGANFRAHTPTRPASTYLGRVAGWPGAVAAGQLLGNGSMRTTIIFEDGTTWRGTGTSLTIPSAASWAPGYPTTLVGDGGAGSRVFAADVALDLSYSYFQQSGSNVDEAVERAEWSVIETNAVYLRDAAIVHRIGRVIVRTNPSDNPSVSLGEFKTEWESVLPAVLPPTSYDLAATVVVEGSGGLAYVGSIGSSNRYSWNSISGSSTDGRFATVWRHEAGHNWGAGHSEGGAPEGSTVMSGNGLSRFSSPDLLAIVSHRNSKAAILDDIGPFPLPLPPRANADRHRALATGTPNGIDVLANDSDSNGEPITLHSFQTTTHRGGFVTRSRGSGPGGRDELIYTPSPTFTSGLDWFTYRIEDSSGQQSVAHVMILPPPQEPDPSIMADAVSVTSGEWSSSAVWSDSAPATTGKDYEIAASTTVDSAPAGVGDGGLVTFPGDSIRVESGGTLRLRHTSAGGNNHHRVDLKALRLEDGASLQSYNTAAGNVSRDLISPIAITSGTAHIRIQSDSGSAYTNSLNLAGGLFGSGNLSVTGTLQGQSGERRFLRVSIPESTYSGNWTVTGEGTTDNSRRLFLVAEAANALGHGSVTLRARSHLRNASPKGLDSLTGITLATPTSTLQLDQPWNATHAFLEIQSGTLNLGSEASHIGKLVIGGHEIPFGTYNASQLSALGHGGMFTGTGTLSVGVTAVSDGAWTEPATWSDASPAGPGRHYLVTAGFTVDSAPASIASGGTLIFPGLSLRIASGGTLRLRHTSAGGNNTHSVNLGDLLLEDGSLLVSHNTAQGNVIRQFASPLRLAEKGTVRIRIQSDHSNSYSNVLQLDGELSGAADITLEGTLQGQAGERRILRVNHADNPFTGDWTISGEGTTDNSRRLFLIADAPNALGTGGVTLHGRAALRNGVSGGLDSLSGVTLTSSTSTLDLIHPWNNSEADLVLRDGTFHLGSGSSTIGTLRIDDTVVPAGTYDAEALAALGHGGTFSGTGTVTVTSPQPLTTASNFQSWISLYGVDPFLAGPYDDADNDGLANVIEFLLDSNPVSGTNRNLPLISMDGEDLIFTFTRRNADKFESIVEYATNPAGPWIVADPEMIDIRHEGSTHTITARIPLSEGTAALFARLRVRDF